jgi:methylenetetrahydrofolate dehydrogenase (NADP+) / methenyltetrahydrofolate cyclohydrolase
VVAQIWDGGDVARELLENVRQQVMHLQHEGRLPPTLAEIRVGQEPFEGRLQMLHADACRDVGIPYQVYAFPSRCSHQAIRRTLAHLNADTTIGGITIDTQSEAYMSDLAMAIAPEKDVDGIHPLHLGRLVTNTRVRPYLRGAEIVQLLKHAGLTLMGLHVICMGNASGLAGLLAFLCLHEHATVSVWKAPAKWPMHMLPRGDVLILDSDDLPSLTGAALKPGVVVVDACPGLEESLLDQPESMPEAVSLLIPVPGGIGPTTIARRLLALLSLGRASVITSLDS